MKTEEGTYVLLHPWETQIPSYLKDGCKYTDEFKRNLPLRTNNETKEENSNEDASRRQTSFYFCVL